MIEWCQGLRMCTMRMIQVTTLGSVSAADASPISVADASPVVSIHNDTIAILLTDACNHFILLFTNIFIN